MSILIESYVPVVQENGLNTNKNINQIGLTGLNQYNTAVLEGRVASPAPATATLTAAQVATGYITSTSAAATTLTMPTGTLLGAALGATAGDCFNVVVDNTAGANTVTIAVATNGILSAAAVAGAGAGAGLLTVPAGVTGIGMFTLMFSSPTAYAFSRAA